VLLITLPRKAAALLPGVKGERKATDATNGYFQTSCLQLNLRAFFISSAVLATAWQQGGRFQRSATKSLVGLGAWGRVRAARQTWAGRDELPIGASADAVWRPDSTSGAIRRSKAARNYWR
jgi:hypothetical protein